MRRRVRLQQRNDVSLSDPLDCATIDGPSLEKEQRDIKLHLPHQFSARISHCPVHLIINSLSRRAVASITMDSTIAEGAFHVLEARASAVRIY